MGPTLDRTARSRTTMSSRHRPPRPPLPLILALIGVVLVGGPLACGGDNNGTGLDPEPSEPSIPEEIPPIPASEVLAVDDVLLVTNQVTVVIDAALPISELRERVEDLGGRLIATLPGTQGTGRRIVQVELETSSAEEVARVANELVDDPEVVTALERILVGTDAHLDNEALSDDQARAYGTIRSSDAWHLIARSSPELQSTRLGVIDTGVDSDHPELEARLALGQSFLRSEPVTWEDSHGHGTWVAGAIAARADNGGMNGVAGPAESRLDLYVYRAGLVEEETVGDVLESSSCASGRGVLDRLAILAALGAAQAHRLHVVNMSFGPFTIPSLEGAAERTIRYLNDLLSRNENLVLVAAAGNQAKSAEKNWPIGNQHDRFILVGGSNGDRRWQTGDPCAESAVGPISIAAPASDVWTTRRGGGYRFASGTSLAAPLVTGAVGLLRTLGVPAGDVKELLRSSATNIETDAGPWRRLDACRAAAQALGWSRPESRIFAESGQERNQPPSDLHVVEPFECGEDERIARIRTPTGEMPVITDLALDADSTLWGSSFTHLYRINRDDATAREVGAFGGTYQVNALDFASDGTLYGATQDVGLFGAPREGRLLHIDTTSAEITEIGSLGSDLQTAGDIEFADGGTLYAAVRDISSGENALAEIDTVSGKASVIGTRTGFEFENVFGLQFVKGVLFGLTADEGDTGMLIVIDPSSGTAELVRTLDFSAFGAGVAKR